MLRPVRRWICLNLRERVHVDKTAAAIRGLSWHEARQAHILSEGQHTRGAASVLRLQRRAACESNNGDGAGTLVEWGSCVTSLLTGAPVAFCGENQCGGLLNKR